MKVRNCLIITDDDSEIVVSLAELGDFSENVVYQKRNVPPDLMERLREFTGIAKLKVAP